MTQIDFEGSNWHADIYANKATGIPVFIFVTDRVSCIKYCSK